MANIVITSQLFSWADKGMVSQQRQRQCAVVSRQADTLMLQLQHEPGSREVIMDSYGVATVFRSRRHDSFNRKLASDLVRRDSKGGVLSGGIYEKIKDFPGNWMRQDLARINKHGS
jgi:hypothetical protein